MGFNEIAAEIFPAIFVSLFLLSLQAEKAMSFLVSFSKGSLDSKTRKQKSNIWPNFASPFLPLFGFFVS